MIDLGKLKAAKVSGVTLGHLVIYTHGEQQLFGLRVDFEADTPHERVGLLLLCFDTEQRGSRPAPAAFSQVGDDLCLDMGKPVVAWDGDVTSIAIIGASSSPLVVAPEGTAITGRLGTGLIDRAAWGVASGTRLEVRSGYRVNKWQIGVIGTNGEFVALVKYPEHYSEKVR